MSKYIYYFGATHTEGTSDMQEILGGKGAGLAEMSRLGIPVPPGFTITTDVCGYYYKNQNSLPENFVEQLRTNLVHLENDTGKIFGDIKKPLLLSVRSGAAISMPGMMDTILNLGMNDDVCRAIIDNTGNKNFALDCYRRFLEMYGSIVLGVPHYLFEDAFELNNIENSEISTDILERIVDNFGKIILKFSGRNCPADAYTQLQSAIESVFQSWNNERAIVYRKLNNISESLGTAVNVQSMVFGNMNNQSATGVVFTRCPSTGVKKLFGEFLINAQGEDIVAGTKTPTTISGDANSMQQMMPDIFDELNNICIKLENHYLDAQDIEFTVENNKLYLLQTRSAKRNASAAIKIAVDMAEDGLISKKDALMRVEAESLGQLLHNRIDYTTSLKPIAQGLAASPGAATGIAVFSTNEAEILSSHRKVILVRNDTSPEDIKGMYVASGIITARGGMTSHAAVVTRGMGKPCICGINGLIVNENDKSFKIGEITVKHGDEITIDGSTGQVFLGKTPLVNPVFSQEFAILLAWADEIRTLGVRANAETVADAETALNFGAEGIGLCRTEHMFFDAEKIPLIQEMIVACDAEQRKSAINKLLPLQIEDFKNLFRTMNGKAVNVRLLDPPLHEFLPIKDSEKSLLAKNLNIPTHVLQQRLENMHETNPMLGHRGCRLGISNPEIYQMQVQAIFEAVQALQKENLSVELELMIPFVSNAGELKILKEHIKKIYDSFSSLSNVVLTIGVMIELPRAALISGFIAGEVDYFSFGTNDLTQTTYGISRDDISSFLPNYIEQKIFAYDPFVILDEEGVGELMNIALKRGKKVNPDLKLGVCGEHAGNSQSIKFFHRLGLDYVSCSPYRIPTARLAAAQAVIMENKGLTYPKS